MKILITGANGQLGRSIHKIENDFPEFKITYTDIEDLNILSEDQVASFISKVKPDFLINCAAYTSVDQAEKDGEKARKLNSYAPGLLAGVMHRNNAKTIHISTDYVFDGNKGGEYFEDDIPTARSMYGKSKAEGEKSVLKYPGTIVIRTSWLYSEFGKNFFKTMNNLLLEKKEIKVVNDQTGTPTYATDLAKTLLRMVQFSKKGKLSDGIYHYSNEGIASWYEFAGEISKKINSSCTIHPVTTKEFPLPAPRPSYSVMNKDKIKRLGISLPDWKESLGLCLKAYQKTILN